MILGSSPLTRGKHAARVNRRVEHGLIPAHAGKTERRRRDFIPHPAHPRSRGENHRVQHVARQRRGSSPLTRGKLSVSQGKTSAQGLIPAHAGKTARRGAAPIRARAHPRSRGENVGACERGDNAAGSSPLTRGKLSSIGGCIRRVGLIPAHAGKTSPTRQQPATPGAHPRSRGENIQAVRAVDPFDGSSPLTRGKLTPIVGAVVEVGSSPLTRGKLTRHLSRRHRVRLIPAHAGKTLPDLRFYRADRSDLGKP